MHESSDWREGMAECTYLMVLSKVGGLVAPVEVHLHLRDALHDRLMHINHSVSVTITAHICSYRTTHLLLLDLRLQPLPGPPDLLHVLQVAAQLRRRQSKRERERGERLGANE